MLLNEADLKLAVPISSNFEYSRLEPDIRRAQLKYLKPILGTDLTADLDGKYEGGITNADEDELIKYIQPALGHLAMWLYVPKGNVYVGDNGIQAVHSGDSKPAFEWQKRDFENSMLQNGFDALDELIEYLESVANTDFPDWLLSEGCTLVRSNFVNTARRFTDFVPKVKSSRFLFSYIKPILSRLEKPLIMSLTGKAQYDELKDEIKADSLTANNLELMAYIEPAVAHAAWASALYELGLQVDGEGVHLMNNTFSGTVQARQAAETDRLRVVKEHHEQVSADYLEQLKEYLVANVDTYPLFKAGESYDSEDPNPAFMNDDESGVLGLL